MEIYFDHEKLKVYKTAIEFVAWSDNLLCGITKKAALKDQLERASISIPLNIAEGNGKSWAKERSRFMEIARGSAVECAACLDAFVAKRLIDGQTAFQGKRLLYEIVCMLTGLINSFSTRIAEEEAGYRFESGLD